MFESVSFTSGTLALEVNKLGCVLPLRVLEDFLRGTGPVQSHKETISDLHLLCAFFPKIDLLWKTPVLMGCLTTSPKSPHGIFSEEMTPPASQGARGKTDRNFGLVLRKRINLWT